MRDLDRIARVLKTILPDAREARAVLPLTTGFSNETYLIEGCDLVLRLPPSAGAMLDGHDVLGQARIYDALSGIVGAPPVPRIVLMGEDDSLLGCPFYVMERMPGEAVNDINMQSWFTEAADATRERMCDDWIATLAGLSRLPVLGVLGPPVTPEDDLRKWRAFAGAAKCPQLVHAIDRLLKVPAPLSGSPSLVHGDMKLSNLLWHGGQISALLDWEMAINGEPLSDLGYTLYSFESPYHVATRAQKLSGMFNRDQVIARWSKLSGRSAQGIEWHETAQIAKICAIIAEGVNMFNTGRSSDPKLAYFKQNFDYYLSVMNAMLDGQGLGVIAMQKEDR